MTQLTRNDLWSLEEYATRRTDFRAEVMAHKKNPTACSGGARAFVLRRRHHHSLPNSGNAAY